ncbi:hypothetical protein V8G54_004407 [Vigna mungo]|uniref:Uncharacterized protein n=1 Tax=Vigna mungo TaxID=3915 RepID=A0AAQ3SE54_VIGMU
MRHHHLHQNQTNNQKNPDLQRTQETQNRHLLRRTCEQKDRIATMLQPPCSNLVAQRQIFIATTIYSSPVIIEINSHKFGIKIPKASHGGESYEQFPQLQTLIWEEKGLRRGGLPLVAFPSQSKLVNKTSLVKAC